MTMLTLTLLDGPLAGRPMPLPQGVLTLGDGESDIAMALECGTQVALSLGDNGVRLLTPAPVWVDGMPLPSTQPPSTDDGADGTPTGQALPLHTVIDLAGLGLWLSDANQPPPSPLPTRPARQTVATPAPNGVESAASSGEPGGRAACKGRDGAEGRERRRAPATWLALTGLSLLIAASGVAIWRTGTANVISRAPPPDSLNALKTLAARIAPDVTFHAAGDTVRLSGGCLDDDTRARLRAEARWLGKALSDETWCPDQAVQTARTLLRLHGFGEAQVNVATDGALMIGGPLVADARWRAASDALDALRLPHGWRITEDTTNSFERLVKTLRDAGQLRGIDISRDRNGWRLTGALAAGRLASLKGIADTWNTSDDTVARYPIRIEPLPSPIPTLAETGFSAPLVSIGGSPAAPQLTLADGTRLAQGVRLPGGTRVIAIHPDGVSISAHDRLFYLPLTPETLHDDSPDPA